MSSTPSSQQAAAPTDRSCGNSMSQKSVSAAAAASDLPPRRSDGAGQPFNSRGRGRERERGPYVIYADSVSWGQEVTVAAPHGLSIRAQVEVVSDDGLILWVQSSSTLPRTLFARNPDSTTWTSR